MGRGVGRGVRRDGRGRDAWGTRRDAPCQEEGRHPTVCPPVQNVFDRRSFLGFCRFLALPRQRIEQAQEVLLEHLQVDVHVGGRRPEVHRWLVLVAAVFPQPDAARRLYCDGRHIALL